jgi:glucose/arabinose dehydrogenase/peptidoglycan/xylan/chitin deacetylase (PgdA/CDA1 family)
MSSLKAIQKVTAGFVMTGLLLGSFPSLTSAALPTGFETEVIATGLNLPTSMAFTPDGRIFIAEKDGSVRVHKNGAVLSEPLIHLTDVNNYGDRGLIGIAVDPNFATNGYVYLSYTYENTPGVNFGGTKTGRIVRVTVVGDTASEATKLVLLGSVGGSVTTPSCQNYAITDDCIPSDSSSHTVGGLRFGLDGKLYATTGDGANFDYVDPLALRAQNIDSLAGKVFRINTDGTAPADNPFYNGDANANRSKVYAYGVRNMFRFNFHPGTGELYGGDVGWSSWEEINKIVSGGNYGWPCREGAVVNVPYNCTAVDYIDPFYVYPHDGDGAGSVTAGAFPTGAAYPAEYANTFFFGDYAQNWIKQMSVTPEGTLIGVTDFGNGADETNGPVEFVTGPEGNVYFIAIYTGEIKRITHTSGNRRPIVQIGANPTSGLAPLAVDFSSTGTSDPDGNPITFLWNFGDGATSVETNPSHAYTVDGSYNPTLTVNDDQGGVQTKSISVTVGNRAPTAQITSPVSGSLYAPGSTLQLVGNGTDPEDGTLPDSALSWRVILHHNIHIHVLETHTGNNISIPAPDHGDPSVYTEIELTTTDSGGLTKTTSVNIYLDNGGSQGGNLVLNGSFEEADLVNAGTPRYWTSNWWGNLNPIFTYPVEGYEGSTLRAAKIEVTAYTEGDAKWSFSPAYVNESTLYTFSDYYTANVPTTIIVQIAFANGTHEYITLGEFPATPTWTKAERTFTTPVGARTATVFHLLNRVGSLTVDSYSLTTGATPPPTDATLPLVEVTLPLTGTTISGTSTLTASSSDNVGVVGVQFYLDGVIVGGEDTTAPYSADLSTTGHTNGTHTVTAVARDAAGNTATSPAVSVTIENNVTPPPPAPTNLIVNPSVETVSTTTAATPYAWAKGGWGTNQAVFTYPVLGFDGANAVRVAMTQYTDGDAKWYFNDVAVTPGQNYTYTESYMSAVATTILLRYKLTSGAFSYVGLGNVPASLAWTPVTYQITPPANVVSVTSFHILNKVGTLTTDAFSLTPADTVLPTVAITSPTAGATVSGSITVTASSSDNIGVEGVQFYVDGAVLGAEDTVAPYSAAWNTALSTNGAHSLTAIARDLSGNTKTSGAVAVTVSNSGSGTTTPPVNLIVNGDFETNGTAGNPNAWKRGGWGNNNVAYTYPVVGYDGNKGAGVDMTVYNDGDAKWYPNDVTMTPGTIYTFSDWYRASTISDVIGRYTMEDGSYLYFGVKKEIQPSADWKFISATFTPPTIAKSVTFMHLISAIGTLDIDDMSLVASGSATSTNDVTAPIVSIVAPLANATVSGNVTLTASSSDNVGVDHVWFAINGNPVSPNLTTSPYTFVWNSTTVANGTYIVKATTNDAVGNNSTATTTIIVNNTAIPPDTTAPAISITLPAANATTSGVTTITASSSDNVGVAGVRFYIDNVLFGTEDVVAPYQIDWNTASTSNGSHQLTAVARDNAGNLATSSIVLVQVNNAATPANLILNPSLETAGTGGVPANWKKGGWGTHNAVYTYPVAGQDGVSAAKIDITTYTSGDAKWYFDDVPVEAGKQYQFTSRSQATVSTGLTVRFTYADGTVSYVGLGTVPVGAGWHQFSNTITVPANAVSMTVFHTLNAVGSLTVDNYSLTLATAGSIADPFTQGMISLTFDDGWLSHYANAVPILNAAGLKGGFYIITQETLNAIQANRLANPSLETPGAPGDPDQWSRGGWGTHNAVYTYPVAGQDGVSAAKIDITTYTSGDAKWYPANATVAPDQVYTFSDYSISTATTSITIRYTLTDGTFAYVNLGQVGPSSTWQQFTKVFTTPGNAVSMTIFHHLNGVGSLTIDNVKIERQQIYVTVAQALEMQAAGHELGVHTRTHPYLTTLTPEQLESEVVGARQDAIGMGLTPANTFVYPYGDYNEIVQNKAVEAGYITARSVDRGFNTKATDKFALKIQQINVTTTVAEVKAWMDTAIETKTWLILMFHQTDEEGASLSITPAHLEEITTYITTENMPVVTMAEGVALMNP